jgi:hypothetical protein
MHLAIMALSLGKPAITFSTQGKVEGLMELFGTGFLMIDPCVGMSSDVVPLIDRVEADYDSIVLEIYLVGCPRSCSSRPPTSGACDNDRGGRPVLRHLDAVAVRAGDAQLRSGVSAA